MARVSGKDSMKQVQLMAFYTDSQITRNREGEMTGVYLDVQVDQSDLSMSDVLDGKAQINPSLDTHRMKNGKLSHGVWYSKAQFDSMCSVSEPRELGASSLGAGMNVMAFVSDIVLKEENGTKHMVVLTPKNPELAKTDAERAEIDRYNQRHPMTVSPHTYNVPLDAPVEGFDDMFDQSERMKPKSDSVESQLLLSKTIDFINSDDFSKDRLANVTPDKITPEIRLMFDGTQTEQDSIDSRKRTDEAIARMYERDGRLYPVDYSLMMDKDAWDKACREHDGIICVGAYSATCLVYSAEGFGDSFVASSLDNVSKWRGIGSEFVWLDSVERQIENEKSHPELLPANQHEGWQEKMDTYCEDIRGRMNGKMYRDVRALERQIDEQRAKPAKKLQSNMASKDMHLDEPLIAVWSDSDVRYDKDGKPKGAYLDIQVDQSGLTQEQIRAGKGYSSPSVHYAYVNTVAAEPHKQFYTQRQLDMMLDVGTTADYGDKHGCSFTANVYTRVNENTGNGTSFVCLPKDASTAKSAEDLAAIEWYNETNKLRGSQHEAFGPDDLKRQFDVTSRVRNITESKARSAELAESFATTVSDVESEVEQVVSK